ncbi:hypothetical protein CRE_25452 [Caenorhabditis remanei]|uniref:Uncharacterized protein n=1 Tax=Caenorhabditis remanei TaxID=31234 RepID=E3LT87_CAERE|nr:hypothetical protein CRE_25452 [Caenorhabditis remanei]
MQSAKLLKNKMGQAEKIIGASNQRIDRLFSKFLVPAPTFVLKDASNMLKEVNRRDKLIGAMEQEERKEVIDNNNNTLSSFGTTSCCSVVFNIIWDNAPSRCQQINCCNNEDFIFRIQAKQSISVHLLANAHNP